MEYITYKRFRGNGISGQLNIPYGTIVEEQDGFLYTSTGSCICAVTSENGWGHFRPHTPEGAQRQTMLDKLYQYYESGKGNAWRDFNEENWPNAKNLYWKNLLRTMSTGKLRAYYQARIGEKLESENTLCIK